MSGRVWNPTNEVSQGPLTGTSVRCIAFQGDENAPLRSLGHNSLGTEIFYSAPGGKNQSDHRSEKELFSFVLNWISSGS